MRCQKNKTNTNTKKMNTESTQTQSLSELFEKYQEPFKAVGWIWKNEAEIIKKLDEECEELNDEIQSNIISIQSILEESADIAIVSFALAKMNGYDFEKIIKERIYNNLNRFQTAHKSFVSFSACWDDTKRNPMNWEKCK